MSEENNEVVEENTEAVATDAVESEGTTTAEVVTSSEELAFSDKFVDSISNEELKSNKLWERLKGKDADEFAKYITELQSYNGRKGDIPKEDATPEEWAEFYGKLGRPESIEGYDFSLNKEFTDLVGEENTPYYQTMVDGFKEQAFELGLSAEKASGLVEWYLDKTATDINGVTEISSKQAEDNKAALDKEWGDSRPAIEGAVHALLSQKGADIEALKASGILSDPAIAIPLGKIASDLGDDPEIGHHMTNTMTGLQDQLSEARSEVMEYMKRGEHPPAHVKQRFNDLQVKLGDNL